MNKKQLFTNTFLLTSYIVFGNIIISCVIKEMMEQFPSQQWLLLTGVTDNFITAAILSSLAVKAYLDQDFARSSSYIVGLMFYLLVASYYLIFIWSDVYQYAGTTAGFVLLLLLIIQIFLFVSVIKYEKSGKGTQRILLLALALQLVGMLAGFWFLISYLF